MPCGVSPFWPTTKFRYLVPIFPLVLVLGAWLLIKVQPVWMRALLGSLSTVALIFVSAWTWAVIPSHTYYYDGGVVTDNFGQQGETVWAGDARRIAQAAEVIRSNGPGTVLGDHLFYSLARQPLVINSTGYPRDALETLVADIKFATSGLEQPRLDEVRQWLGGTVIHEDGAFGLLDCVKLGSSYQNESWCSVAASHQRCERCQLYAIEGVSIERLGY